MGYMAAKKDKRIASATFFVALLDFSVPGELGVFIDEGQVASLEKKMEERGYLEGSEMGTTFNMLRSNDLIWTFVVNNYLMGKEPFPFDLLYWNSDSTRMPYKMHSYYLRNMYMKNLLRVPGGITLLDTPIDISKVKTPCYFISTIEDHIAPWRSVYLGSTVLGGPVRFVLGGSGHIAGIVNPPSANKYGFWTNDKRPDTPDEWFAGAKQNEGSWWTDWQKWITNLNDDKVPARDPAKGKFKALEDAPGSFVKFRLDASKTRRSDLRSGERPRRGPSRSKRNGCGAARRRARFFVPSTPRRVVLDTNVLVSLYVFADSRLAPLRALIESGELAGRVRRRVLGGVPPRARLPLFALADWNASRRPSPPMLPCVTFAPRPLPGDDLPPCRAARTATTRSFSNWPATAAPTGWSPPTRRC
jgi:hypothetical protein